MDELLLPAQRLFGAAWPTVWTLAKIIAITVPLILCVAYLTLVERKVTPHIKFVYEMSGETREQAEARIAKRDKGHEIAKAGIYQASQWIENQFPNPAEPKA